MNVRYPVDLTQDERASLDAIATWQRARNAARERIRWMFTVEKARKKMGRTYPTLPPATLPLAPEPASERQPIESPVPSNSFSDTGDLMD